MEFMDFIKALSKKIYDFTDKEVGIDNINALTKPCYYIQVIDYKNEFFANYKKRIFISVDIMYIPEKRNKYCIKGGDIMLENKIETYEKSIKKILKNDLKIECDNYLENEDDFLIWNSNIYLKKRIFDDKGDYIDKKLLEIVGAKIIPASMDFNDETSFYSPLDYCDSVSGDMYFSYKAIGDDEGIKEEIVKELEMEEEEAYETSVLYVENVEVKESENLNTFLQAFDIVRKGLPVQYCKLAIFLLEWQKESKKVKVFLENGWKIRNIDSSSVVMYKKI